MPVDHSVSKYMEALLKSDFLQFRLFPKTIYKIPNMTGELDLP
jgi:hypothetical protein